MASIVYDNIKPSAEGGGGNLFKGKTFFIHRKCPSHRFLKTAVEANGGTVLPLENNAEYFIYDDARKDCPPGSISWKFIEDCVKHGKFRDPEEYLLNDPAAQRPVACGLPVKTTRRPFTPAEDAEFKEHMLQCLAGGKNTSGGNSVYQEYAKLHTRHPWQAWKDRWRRQLEPLLKKSEKERIGNVRGRSPTGSLWSGRTSPRETPHLSRQGTPAMEHSAAAAVAAAATAAAPMATSAPIRRTRQPFTADDDQLIVNHVEEQMYYSNGLRGSKIWSQLAERHPHHTDQSWRNRYIRVIEPRMKEDGTGPYDSAMTAQIPAPTNRLEERRSPSVKREEPVDSGDHATQSGNPGMGVQDQPDQANDEESHDEGNEIDPETFEAGFETYRAGKDLSRRVEVAIGDMVLDNFEFYRTVVGNNADPASRNWEAIAIRLGFNLGKYPRAPSKLEVQYMQHFSEFEELFSRFEAEDGDFLDATDTDGEEEQEADALRVARPRLLLLEDQDGEMSSRAERHHLFNSVEYPAGGDAEQEQEQGQDSDVDLSLDAIRRPQMTRGGVSSEMPSSPPLLKRKLDAILTDATYPSSSARKRAAIDRSQVIPSTPTHRLQPSGSGSHRRSRASSRRSHEREPAATVTKEPETQDFRFDSQVSPHPPGSGESQIAVSEESRNTPSQQLQDELAQHTSPLRGQLRVPDTSPEHEGGPAKAPLTTPEPTRRILPSSFTRQAQQASPHGLLPLRQSAQSSPAVSSAMPSLRPGPQEASPKRYFPGPAVSTPQPKTRSPTSRRRSGEKSRRSPQEKRSTSSKQTKKDKVGAQNTSAEDSAASARAPAPAEPLPSARVESKLEQEIHDLVALGYKEELVRKAMTAASYNVGVAKQALEPLMGGNPLPDNVPGLWTKQDDRDLRTAYKTDVDKEPESMAEASAQHVARKLRKQLKKKHGKEALRTRRGLWQAWGW